MKTFYDGYVVNAIIEAAYNSVESKRWEPVRLPIWRGREGVTDVAVMRDFDAHHVLIKEERMPDGTLKVILRHKETGKVIQRSEQPPA